jgi:hypothetical protein
MSKKIILTESQLSNLIKCVINEQMPIGNLISTASDASGPLGPVDVSRGSYDITCLEKFKDYENVANSFNWCRTNPKADKYSWADNWAANQVKKDVQTTSSEDLITPALKTISTAKDFCQFVNSYYKYKGDLYNDIDKYVTMYDKWNRIFGAIPKDFKDKTSRDLPACKKYRPGNVA